VSRSRPPGGASPWSSRSRILLYAISADSPQEAAVAECGVATPSPSSRLVTSLAPPHDVDRSLTWALRRIVYGLAPFDRWFRRVASHPVGDLGTRSRVGPRRP